MAGSEVQTEAQWSAGGAGRRQPLPGLAGDSQACFWENSHQIRWLRARAAAWGQMWETRLCFRAGGWALGLWKAQLPG